MEKAALAEKIKKLVMFFIYVRRTVVNQFEQEAIGIKLTTKIMVTAVTESKIKHW